MAQSSFEELLQHQLRPDGSIEVIRKASTVHPEPQTLKCTSCSSTAPCSLNDCSSDALETAIWMAPGQHPAGTTVFVYGGDAQKQRCVVVGETVTHSTDKSADTWSVTSATSSRRSLPPLSEEEIARQVRARRRCGRHRRHHRRHRSLF